MDQPDLFDRPRTAETSAAAAEAIKPSAGTLRALVLAALQNAGGGGLTDQEIEQRTGLGGSTVRPRRGELAAAGLIAESGRTRPTASGRQAVVWVARPHESTGGRNG